MIKPLKEKHMKILQTTHTKSQKYYFSKSFNSIDTVEIDPENQFNDLLNVNTVLITKCGTRDSMDAGYNALITEFRDDPNFIDITVKHNPFKKKEPIINEIKVEDTNISETVVPIMNNNTLELKAKRAKTPVAK